MKRLFNYLLCIVLLFTLTGCQEKTDKKDLRLRVNFQEGDLPSLHPHDMVIYLRGLSIGKNIFEPLTRINAEGKIELAGAKSVAISEDQLRYTFVLRTNYWSDGTPVLASHYEKAWKAALLPTSTCSRSELLYCIKNAESARKNKAPSSDIGVHAVDDETLVVELAYPTPYFLELTAQVLTAPLIDPETTEQKVFNGPFVVAEWRNGSSMHLEPNPYYWNKSEVGLKGIDIYFIEDVNTVFSLFEKKELDWIGVPFCPLSTEIIQHLNEIGTLRSQPIGRSFWVFLNTEQLPLNSPSIRRALSLAIERRAITEHILLGSEPSQKPLSDTLLPLPISSALNQDTQQALQSLNLGLQELGLSRATFPPLEISYSQQANRKQVAEYLQECWSKVLGIPVILKAVEWNVLRSNLEKGLFAVSMAYEGPLYGDPFELLERYATLNPSNFPQWQDGAFSEKIALAKYERDPGKRMALLAETEEILIKEMPVIPICYDRLLYSHPNSLSGYVIDKIGAVDFSKSKLK